RFFREAYSAEQVLSDLSEQARGFTETEPLLRTILQLIGETFHVETLAVFLRKDNVFRLQQAYGLAGTLDVLLPENSSTVQTLVRSGGSPRLVSRGSPA